MNTIVVHNIKKFREVARYTQVEIRATASKFGNGVVGSFLRMAKMGKPVKLIVKIIL